MTIKIENGVPIPTRIEAAVYPFASMEIGDSFSVPTTEDLPAEKLRQRLSANGANFAKRHLGVRFTTRVENNGGSVRIWRVPPKSSLLADAPVVSAPPIPPSHVRTHTLSDEAPKLTARVVKGGRY
ncbi:MAG: hypothetical protein WC809_18650 [Sinimarinibacterium sp.]|jgi:hypothetical protein